MLDLHVDAFAFAFDKRYSPLLALAGITPDTARVEISDDRLTVSFGRWGLDTPLTNVSSVEVTGGYRWYRAIGLRLSLADGGVTFGTNTDRGLCVLFQESLPPVIPMVKRHPEMTVTVADVEALEAVLRRRADLA